jgi:hypothetical protein
MCVAVSPLQASVRYTKHVVQNKKRNNFPFWTRQKSAASRSLKSVQEFNNSSFLGLLPSWNGSLSR